MILSIFKDILEVVALEKGAMTHCIIRHGLHRCIKTLGVVDGETEGYVSNGKGI
jgi:hypothetical protein